MFRPLAVFVLTIGAAVAAFAGLPETLTTLRGAIDARIVAIGVPASKPLKTELKHLKKASKALLSYGGTLEVADLNQLRKAGLGIGSSHTTDTAIIQSGIDAVNDLLAALQANEAQLYELADQFIAIEDREELDRLIVLAREDAMQAAAIADTDIPGAMAFARAAGVKYYKALRFAQDVVEALGEARQPILGFPFVVQNRNGVTFKVTKLVLDVYFTPSGGGARQRVTLDLKPFGTQVGTPLPATLPDSSSTFAMYPLMYAALTSAIGGSPDGGTMDGSLQFTSSKHGTVDIRIDEFFVSAPF